MRKFRLAALVMVPSVAFADLILMAGNADDCGTGADATSPSADLEDALAADGIGSGDLKDFDEGHSNMRDHYVAHTFDFSDSPRTIVEATLESMIGWGFSSSPVSGELSDGVALEGSYGRDSAGAERPQDTTDWECAFTQQLAGRCDVALLDQGP